jgi:hypothetical protein
MTKQEYIELRVLELTARKERAEDYCLNNQMQIEGSLLGAQIEALISESLRLKFPKNKANKA